MPSPSSPVRLAFIGTGGIANAHAAAASALKERAVITAGADPSDAARRAFAAKTSAAVFDSADALFAARAAGSVAFDAAVLCTPPNVRTAVVNAALGAGVHTLVEKPIASSPADAAALANAAAAHPALVAAVGYCHRFTPAVLEMRRMARAGELGTPTRFENVFAFHHPPMSERWFSDPAVSGGGSFIDTGCHSLDLFAFLVGEPEVAGAVLHHAWKGRGDSSAATLVRARSGDFRGVAGVILAGWLEPARFQVRLVGTEGSVFYDYDHPLDLVVTRPDGKSETRRVETHELRFERQLGAFTAAVAERRSASDVGLATFRDGVVVAEAVDKAHAAARLYN